MHFFLLFNDTFLALTCGTLPTRFFFFVVQDISEWPVIEPLPSYGRGRDAAAGRYSSLISGTNLTDVIVTGMEKVALALNNYQNQQLRVGKAASLFSKHVIRIQSLNFNSLTLLSACMYEQTVTQNHGFHQIFHSVPSMHLGHS